MTTRLQHHEVSYTINNNNNNHGEEEAEAAILITSSQPFHNPRLFTSSRVTMAEEEQLQLQQQQQQQLALLQSHVGIPPEITDSIQSWVDVQESIDEAMRESPIPGGRLSVGSSSTGIHGIRGTATTLSGAATPSDCGMRGTAAIYSGAATPSSLARLTFLHPSSERLLQAGESPTPGGGQSSSSPRLASLQSPIYIDSPDLLSVHSQSPPADDGEEDADADKKSETSILERICFDRVNAAAACLNSQVQSGVIDSEKVIGEGECGDWVWDWSSRPEATPPKDATAAFSRLAGKRKTASSSPHRKTDPLSRTNAFLLRLEVFSMENLPILFVSHACSVLLGAALMLFYIKRR